jgi:electron transfer flavoprotein alpha subunit
MGELASSGETMEGKPSSILVLAELADGKLAPIVFEVVGLARQMADSMQETIRAVVFGRGAAAAGPQMIAAGADTVYVTDSADFVEYQPDVWLAALANVVRQSPVRLVLMGHTNLGADLAPRLAFRLGGAVATNCEAATIDGDKLLITRPCYGNKARSIVWLKKLPAVVTVRAKSRMPVEPDPRRVGEVMDIARPADQASRRSRVIDRRAYAFEGPQLESARVVVAGGRGVGGPEGFRLLESLAQTLGAVVGASRVACDLGWCPLSMQIGLTGKTIAPDLYVAVGISGASQHMAGCGGAKTILAINMDPQAPIFDEATLGVVGDYKELIPRVIEEVRRLKADS